MSLFDLHSPDLAPTHHDLGALDRQVKAIFTTALHIASPISSVGLVILPRNTYFATMRIKDPDVFDRIGSGLWAYRLVRTKYPLKDAGSHKHSPIGSGYLRIPASTIPDLSYWVVGTPGIMRLCLLPSLRSRTRTLIPICFQRFVRFVETNWMVLAIMA
jgi:hypothetical protein